jgi:hypothetical protein
VQPTAAFGFALARGCWDLRATSVDGIAYRLEPRNSHP